eukprot:5444554-Pleurochrysis_carterae.AAC.1
MQPLPHRSELVGQLRARLPRRTHHRGAFKSTTFNVRLCQRRRRKLRAVHQRRVGQMHESKPMGVRVAAASRGMKSLSRAAHAR